MSADYLPVSPAVTEQLKGSPRCVFVTGGPRVYLHGINCIARRLEMLQSAHPLVVVTEKQDEKFMRRHVMAGAAQRPLVVAWRRFPHPFNRTVPWRYRSPRVMDKLNLFGLPVRRLVWLDADIFLRGNVDELCDLPAEVRVAAALDDMPKLTSATKMTPPAHCWQAKDHHLSRATKCAQACRSSRKVATTPERRPFVGLRASEFPPPHDRCPYVLNSGVMVVSPFAPREFNDLVVKPVKENTVESYDSGDQGIIASLLYGMNGTVFGSSYMRLHPRYNVLARQSGHAEVAWGGQIAAKLLHFTRDTRPWLNSPAVAHYSRAGEAIIIDAKTRAPRGRAGSMDEWLSACGAGVCQEIGSDVGQGTFTAATDAAKVSRSWKRYCDSGQRKQG